MTNQPAQQTNIFLLWDFIKQELTYFPGRGNLVLRYVISASLVVIISSTLQVPAMSYSILIAFMITSANITVVKTACPLIIFGHFIIASLSILNIKLTIDYPLLRLLNSALLLFLLLYLSRIPSKFRSVFSLVSIFVTYSQSFVDSSPSPEELTRSLLWLFVYGSYPAVIVYFVNVVFLPLKPAKIFENEAENILNNISKRLINIANGILLKTISINNIQNRSILLTKYFNSAKAGEDSYRDNEDKYIANILTISMLYHSAAQLNTLAAENKNPLVEKHCHLLAKECQRFKQAFLERKDYILTTENIDEIDKLPECLQSMYQTLLSTSLHDEMETTTDTNVANADSPPPSIHKSSFHLSHENIHAALKTLLSVAICYVIYTSVQWSGIHTSMLTCIIVALPGLGASLHKGFLRIAGCIFGSGLVLFCTVFILPHVVTITGLLLMSLPAFIIAGWVTAGSERISYAGIQIIFAYAAAMYDKFYPTPDIPEIRDRFIGILLGIFVSTLISISLWPEKEGHTLRNSFVKMLEYLSTQLQKLKSNRKNYILGLNQLDSTKSLIMRVKLEPNWNDDTNLPDIRTKGQVLLTKLYELHMILYRLQRDVGLLKNKYPDLDLTTLKNMMQTLSDAIQSYGQGLAQNPPQYVDISKKILSSESHHAFIKAYEAMLASGQTREEIVMKRAQTLIDICRSILPWDELHSCGTT